ncbi:MAG: hypothetical protein H6867_10105 [Rhodospirillales bacterium]|nr:hypothetical protein [Rhodospirillales bacterium]MCB9995863.1 hypothetical protein [Rhodospirillales bacterium]
MKRLLASAALILSLSACASALEKATQEVNVVTPGAHESVCYLDNGEVIYRVWPPQTVRVSKRPGDLKVRCVADGDREKSVTIDTQHQALVLANAFNGFAPGIFIDYHTGAMFAYPETITVDFSDMQAGKMPRPAYDRYLQDNPDLFGMEEFRPGDAALMSDRYEEPVALKKREFINSSDFAPIAAPAETGEAGGESGEGASDASADSLTRQMNPQVFDPAPSGSFAGGTSSDDPAEGPMPIHPAE